MKEIVIATVDKFDIAGVAFEAGAEPFSALRCPLRR
jgi:hypothetical protein